MASAEQWAQADYLSRSRSAFRRATIPRGFSAGRWSFGEEDDGLFVRASQAYSARWRPELSRATKWRRLE